MFGFISRLVYPTRCLLCHEIQAVRGICDDCRAELPQLMVGKCAPPRAFSKCCAAFGYEGKVRDAIHRYKFRGATGNAAQFADFMAASIVSDIDINFDVVTWVPLHWIRLRTRGYDQAQLLAEEVAKRLSIPVCKCLKKTRYTRPQSKTASAHERVAHIAGAYGVIDCSAVAGKRILLIDDVLTTGATSSECAYTLRFAGARDVCLAVIARTQKAKKTLKKVQNSL